MSDSGVLSALDRIASNTVKERSEGITDLKRILRQIRRDDAASSLAGVPLQVVLDRLERAVTSSKNAHHRSLKSNSKTTKASGASRLSACSSIYRSLIQHCATKFRWKTARSVLDFLAESFAGDDGDFCEPIALDVFKSINEILSFEPHLQHMLPKEWQKVCIFVMTTFRRITALPGPSSSHRDSMLQSTRRYLLVEVTKALRLLLTSPAAPLASFAERLLALLVEYLDAADTVGNTEAEAVLALYNLLSRTCTEAVSLIFDHTARLLPLITKTWIKIPSRSQTIRDDLLNTVVILLPFLRARVRQHELAEAFATMIDALKECVFQEYAGRTTKDLLRLDDLTLTSSEQLGSLHFGPYGLRDTGDLALRNWTALSVTAHLVGLSAVKSRHTFGSSILGNARQKRVRRDTASAELIRLIREPNTTVSIAGLQLLAFYCQLHVYDEAEYTSLAEFVLPLLTDDNLVKASWALLAFASLASRTERASEHMSQLQGAAFKSAGRATEIATTCRTACHCMSVLLHHKLVDIVVTDDYVAALGTTLELHGPAACTDSSVELLVKLLEHCRTTRQALFGQFAKHTMAWAFRTWDPGSVDNSQTATNLDLCLDDLLRLLTACLQRPRPRVLDLIVTGTKSVWQIYDKSRNVIGYLLNLDYLDERLPSAVRTTVVPKAKTDENSRLVKDFLRDLVSKHITNFLEAWQRNIAEKGPSPGENALHTGCLLYRLGNWALASIGTSELTDVAALRAMNSRVCTVILQGLASADASPKRLRLALRVLLSCIRLDSEDTADLRTGDIVEMRKWHDQLYSLAFKLGPVEETQSTSFDAEESSMDLDDADMNLSLRTGQNSGDSQVSSASTASGTSEVEQRSCARLLTKVLVCRKESGGRASTKPLEDEVRSMGPDETVAGGSVLLHLHDLAIELNEDLVLAVLDNLGEVFRRSYHVGRSEKAMELTLEFLSSSIDVWILPSTSELRDAVLDFYDFFVSAALTQKVLSVKAQELFSDLLINIWRKDEGFGQTGEEPPPSIRTTLFSLIGETSLALKHYQSSRIETIFSFFTTANHDALFDDLQANLPVDLDWSEGIAVRVAFFANLGSRWHTLLRKAVYYIFDSAGQAETCKPFASRAIQQIATSQRFAGPESVFRVFRSQLIYTWMSEHRLQEMPFAIFAYASIEDLVEANLGEIVGLCYLLEKADEVEYLASTLKQTESWLIRQSIVQVATYTIAHDISLNSTQGGLETRIRSHFPDASEYLSMLKAELPHITAKLLLSTHFDAGVDKAIDKRHQTVYAKESLARMKAFSCSLDALPPNLEPSFRGKHLLDGLDRIARRGSLHLTDLIAEPTFVAVIRLLLDAMHPSLGPIHARGILHKIRLLCALAGSTIGARYPIEMLIQAIGPMLKDARCADDAVGVLKEIFDQGKQTLQTTSPVFTASVISTVTACKLATSLSFDILTQESRRQTTVTNLDKFQKWLVEYALADGVGERHRQRYVRLITSCGEANYPATLDDSSPAAKYLMVLLEDAKHITGLLTPRDRDRSIREILQNSKPLAAPAPIFGTNASKYAAPMWKAMQGFDLAPETSIWLGRIVGKAYSITGPSMLRDLKIQSATSVSSSQDAAAALLSSRSAITEALLELLQSSQPAHVSVAEKTLRAIVSAFVAVDEKTTAFSIMPGYLLQALDLSLSPSLNFQSFTTLEKTTSMAQDPEKSLASSNKWLTEFATSLISRCITEPTLAALPHVFEVVDGFVNRSLPALVHVCLSSSFVDTESCRRWVAESFTRVLNEPDRMNIPIWREILEVIVYLLSQPMDKEASRQDRLHWLELDFLAAGRAALACSLPAYALFMVELLPRSTSTLNNERSLGRASSQRPSSEPDIPHELLMDIFDQIDDPDAFYSVARAPTLANILQKVDREDDPYKSLLLHSGFSNASARLAGQAHAENDAHAISALSKLHVDSLTRALLSNSQILATTNTARTAMMTAQRLYEWDLQMPDLQQSSSTILFEAFKSFDNAATTTTLRLGLSESTTSAMALLRASQSTTDRTSLVETLSVLNDLYSLSECRGVDRLQVLLESLSAPNAAWPSGHEIDLQDLVAHRETMFGVLRRNTSLHQELALDLKDAILLEVKAVQNTTEALRVTNNVRGALSTATYLQKMIPECQTYGLSIAAYANLQMAAVLWDQGESQSSVNMMQAILSDGGLEEQSVPVGLAGVLAQLGHQVAVARLERPEDTISRYLKPALQSLTKTTSRTDQSKVFFEFASFCDQQLQDPDRIADFERLKSIRHGRLSEHGQLTALLKDTPTTNKEARSELNRSIRKARQWIELDETEYKRMSAAREEFVQQCLINYLRALRASEKYDAHVVRFFSLWLEHDDSTGANEAVGAVLHEVASWKFVTLLNQIMSRMQDDGTPFQDLLMKLITRICTDHPYHSIYQLFSTSNATVGSADNAANLRKNAANKVAEQLRRDKRTGTLVQKVWQANSLYNALANSKVDTTRTTKFSIRTVPAAYQMNTKISEMGIPPATIHLDLRPAADYRNVPTIIRFREEVSIASGISAPKILTARASDGLMYKQLFKGGNDDLRQDAIMEQVFASVSAMLKNHPATRRRNLGIRTYIVLPLSSTSGIIEFVPNSIPLNDILAPAHAAYHPTDLKWNKAREQIRNAQDSTKEQRLAAYRKVCERFTPVLRHFFLERFAAPDAWFARRLAYARSTAAISMLGHVLGLGDRHCHNILLDETSGEVVHIDLGVAFEAGRVLPVPEAVPFRLTRDVVDGLGVAGTEGVFRRACEEVLRALREEKGAVLTLLNVLRYDPLYSWTLSPLRARRIQRADGEGEGVAVGGGVAAVGRGGEAERALAVVEKKLSPALSASAAVNELIQQASDERNLAVLFAGWAAFA